VGEQTNLQNRSILAMRDHKNLTAGWLISDVFKKNLDQKRGI
jgi:hypothetical protein